MIRSIVFTIFTWPCILLILNLLKKDTDKEKFTDTLYVSKAYQTVCHVGSLVVVAMGLILGLRFGFQETLALDVFLAVFIAIMEMCAFIFRRHKVVIKEDTLRMTPTIGRTRTVKISEVTQFKEKAGIGIKVYLGRKRICTISCDCVGYKQFVRMLEEKKRL